MIEKDDPDTVAFVIVTEEPPVLVKVSERFAVDPTWTLPKERLDGLALKLPGATPVPESGMLRVGLEPFDVMVTLPLAEPAADGANCTLNVVLWPALYRSPMPRKS